MWASTSSSSPVDEVNVLAIIANKLCDCFLTYFFELLLTYNITECDKSKQYTIIANL